MDRKQYSSIPVYSLRLVKEKAIKYPLLQIKGHQQAAAIFQAYLEDQPMENLVVLLLDGTMSYLGLVTITTGGISGLRASIRDVITPVIAHRASQFILGHNHPSGDVTPSPEDLAFTTNVKEASEMMACPLIDHIIVSSGLNKASYSLHDHGHIQP